MTENPLQDVLTKDLLSDTLIKRSKSIPMWMKIFAWIFIVFGAMAPIGLVLGLLGYNFETSLYGLETNNPISLLGISVIMLFILKGLTAFGILKEKDWAINWGIVDAVIGIAICIGMIVYKAMYFSTFSIRLELVALIPYLIRLRAIKKQWETESII
ncbi:MAG: hypothetical protein JST58_18110 [Bacteroidetes bacterium]|nr:hypothetical protein [Bacteroidota bacterium]